MGKIEVRIQTEERMKAITNLSIALVEVAKALNRPPEVSITGCTLNNLGDGTLIKVMTDSDIETTEIIEKEES